MSPTEFARVVEFIEDWWGPVPSWGGAADLTDDFSAIDFDRTISILRERLADSALARYAPSPAQLRASVVEMMRQPQKVLPSPAIPDPPEGFRSWGAWAMRNGVAPPG